MLLSELTKSLEWIYYLGMKKVSLAWSLRRELR